MTRILDGAVPMENGKLSEAGQHSQMSIGTATARANCQVQEVVQLILDHRLAWVGRDVSLAGFASVLVDLDEVKQWVRLPPLDGMPTRAFADSFGVPDVAAARLIEAGYVTGTRAINPINRCPVTIVTTDVGNTLRQEFVSLRDLARDRNINSRRLRRELAAREIFPVPDWLECGAIVYRRQHLVC